MSSSPSEQRNPYLRADSLAELLSWEDQDFVRCAFVTVLGRQPDPEGEFHYLNLIRAGHSKLFVLDVLRNSIEAENHDPGIAGFDRALRRARRQRRAGIGWIFRLASKNPDRNSPRAREHRARMNAATLERYSLHAIGMKLGGIEWTLQQPQQPPGETPLAESDAVASEHADALAMEEHRVALDATPAELDHLDCRTPLARFFHLTSTH